MVKMHLDKGQKQMKSQMTRTSAGMGGPTAPVMKHVENPGNMMGNMGDLTSVQPFNKSSDETMQPSDMNKMSKGYTEPEPKRGQKIQKKTQE